MLSSEKRHTSMGLSRAPPPSKPNLGTLWAQKDPFPPSQCPSFRRSRPAISDNVAMLSLHCARRVSKRLRRMGPGAPLRAAGGRGRKQSGMIPSHAPWAKWCLRAMVCASPDVKTRFSGNPIHDPSTSRMTRLNPMSNTNCDLDGPWVVIGTVGGRNYTRTRSKRQ